MITIGTLHYAIGRCWTCRRPAQVTRADHPLRPWTCLPCIQAAPWYRVMRPAGQALVTLAFDQATYELRDAAAEDARLRRLLAPVERLGALL